MLVRPAVTGDLGTLMALAAHAGAGLTSLPPSGDRLMARLQNVEASFRGGVARADADYLFVLEDEQGEVVGTSGMLAAAGMREPWYSYRIGLTVTASTELQVYQQHPTLFWSMTLPVPLRCARCMCHPSIGKTRRGACCPKRVLSIWRSTPRTSRHGSSSRCAV